MKVVHATNHFANILQQFRAISFEPNTIKRFNVETIVPPIIFDNFFSTIVSRIVLETSKGKMQIKLSNPEFLKAILFFKKDQFAFIAFLVVGTKNEHYDMYSSSPHHR